MPELANFLPLILIILVICFFVGRSWKKTTNKENKTAIWLLGIGIIIPLFNIWAVWLLRKSCSPVMRLFFRRFWIATVLEVVGAGLLAGLLVFVRYTAIPSINTGGDMRIGAMPELMLISAVSYILIVLCLMSGSGLITRYYQLDNETASKVRLFQLGALMFPFLIIVPFFGCLIANLLMFLGLKGIIQSDLVTEKRCGEDCGVVSGGWWSRPVKAMVCFYGCFLVLGGITAVLSANL